MAFNDYIGEVIGVFPRIPQPYIPILLNRAWNNIRDMRLWSFLVGYGNIIAPAAITAGVCSVTNGSPTIIVDATAAAALIAQALLPAPNPPLSSTTLGQGRQFRINGSASAGPWYNIIAWDGVNTLTLDLPYASITQTSIPYTVAKVYYATPLAPPDFRRYLTVTNKTSGYTIRGKRLLYTQQKLNAVDPQRGGTGDAYVIASYLTDSNGNMVHEWYPNPVNSGVYNAFFQRQGLPLSATVDLPSTLDSSLLMYRTFMLACDWATANVSTFSELAQTNWVQLRKQHQDSFRETLIQCIKQDDELMPQMPIQNGYDFDFPLGGQFLQSHDVSSIIGGQF